jgi:hypothetical protein
MADDASSDKGLPLLRRELSALFSIPVYARQHASVEILANNDRQHPKDMPELNELELPFRLHSFIRNTETILRSQALPPRFPEKSGSECRRPLFTPEY